MHFHFEQAKEGMYRILSNVEFEGNNLLVVKRGQQIQLITIPCQLLKVVNRTGEYDTILEITEMGGFRVPSSRPAKGAQELKEIDNFAPTGGTCRSQ